MGNNKIKVAVIGCGDITTRVYLPAITEQTDAFQLVACCDTDGTRARETADRFGAEAYFTDLDKMLDEADIEAVFVNTPHPVHCEPTVEAAEAGKHVMVEKPMCTGVEEADRMIEAAERSGVILMALPWDFDAHYRKAFEILKSGVLGKPVLIDGISGHGGPKHMSWFISKKAKGGALIDMGVYALSKLIGFSGPARSVAAFAGKVTSERTMRDVAGAVPMEVEDNAALVLDFGEGFLGTFRGSWCLPRGMVTVSVICTDGVLIHSVSGGEPLAVFSKKPLPFDGEEIELHGTAGWIRPRVEGKRRKGRIDAIEHFAQCIREKKKPLADAYRQRHVVEIMFASYLSAERGSAIQLRTSFDAHARPVQTKAEK